MHVKTKKAKSKDYRQAGRWGIFAIYHKELITQIHKEFLEFKKTKNLLGGKSKRSECTEEMNLKTLENLLNLTDSKSE